MKKIFLFLLFVLSFSFLAVPSNVEGVLSSASAYDATDTGWKIEDYSVEARIESNRHVTVREAIQVNFNDLEKHGIFRYIPYKYYRNGNNYSVMVKIDSIVNDEGDVIKYQELRTGGNIELKIGDPDFTISGKQLYVITYELERVINSFSDHDEFYWNVTGNDWPVPIQSTRIRIKWPEGAEISDNICFVGSYGEDNKDCSFKVEGTDAAFSAGRTLEPGEGFTVASAIKPGLLKHYSFYTVLGWFLVDNWGYFLPILVLVIMIWKYNKSGRDPRGRTTIVPEFGSPDNLSPAMLGTVLDEKVDTHDISAVIIDMAVKGYLKIKEIEKKGIFGSKDYEFIYSGKKMDNLEDFEKEIMGGIFGSSPKKDDSVRLSDLKEKFYVHIKTIKDNLYQGVVKKGYFDKNPSATRNIYLGIGIGLIFLSFFVVPMAAVFTRAVTSLTVGTVLSGIIIAIFAFFMPKRTEKGTEMLRQIKGFKLYMHTAERYRQKFNEKEKIFERFLPYAMVFGIVKEWAEKFKDMQLDRPEWYEGRGAFYPVVFASNISSMQHSVNSTMVSPPSSAGSGGSGFSGGGSGGGFGGGGGGSW